MKLLNYILDFIIFISFCQISLQTSPFESCHHLLGECRGSEVVVAPWHSPSRAQPVCGSFSGPKKGCLTRLSSPIVKSKLIVKSRTESQMKSLLIFKVSIVSMWNSFWKNDSSKKILQFSPCLPSSSSSNSIRFSSKLRRTQESQKMLKSFHQCQWTPSDQGLNRVCLENGKPTGLMDWVFLVWFDRFLFMYFSSDTWKL